MKRKKYSNSFNESFKFYLDCYRKVDLTFSGTEIQNIKFDIHGKSCKDVFMIFENGGYKNKEIVTKHPNVVFSVIKGKKSFGLHIKMWSEGISEGCFTQEEILEEFTKMNVHIPESFLKEFDNSILRILKKINKC